MPINHDMMHSQSHSMFEKAGEVLEGVSQMKQRIEELERENATLKDMVASSQGRIAELEKENAELKERCELRARTVNMWKRKYEELLR